MASPLFPKSIIIDAAAIAALGKLYRDATADVQKLIRESVAAGLTLVAVRQAQARITNRLAQLQADVRGWADDRVTAAYRDGKDHAIGQLRSFHNDVANRAASRIEQDAALNAAHDEAARALADGMATRLDMANQQMLKSASDTLMRALNESVRGRIAAGETDVAALKKTILDDLNRLDVNALIDRGGKAWAPDTYAEMLSRTSLTQARNQALADSLSSQDFDLVVVSAHGATDACGPWEDTVLSMSGAVPGYPTLADAERSGLFHVNCKHALNTVDPEDYPSGYFSKLAMIAVLGDGTAPLDQNANSGNNQEVIDETAY